MSFGYQVLGFGSGGGEAKYQVQFLVLAGGGAGGRATNYGGGGGGAGGFRTICAKTFCVTVGEEIPITVGSGGAQTGSTPVVNASGANSIFSTITSTGGGGGGGRDNAPNAPYPNNATGNSGGSGGGSNSGPSGVGGAGNTPPTEETLLAEALGQVDLEAEALLVVEDLLAEALQDSLTLAVAAVELELDHLHKELLPVQQQEHLEDQVL